MMSREETSRFICYYQWDTCYTHSERRDHLVGNIQREREKFPSGVGMRVLFDANTQSAWLVREARIGFSAAAQRQQNLDRSPSSVYFIPCMKREFTQRSLWRVNFVSFFLPSPSPVSFFILFLLSSLLLIDVSSPASCCFFARPSLRTLIYCVSSVIMPGHLNVWLDSVQGSVANVSTRQLIALLLSQTLYAFSCS